MAEQTDYLKIAGTMCEEMGWNHDAIPELAECLGRHFPPQPTVTREQVLACVQNELRKYDAYMPAARSAVTNFVESLTDAITALYAAPASENAHPSDTLDGELGPMVGVPAACDWPTEPSSKSVKWLHKGREHEVISDSCGMLLVGSASNWHPRSPTSRFFGIWRRVTPADEGLTCEQQLEIAHANQKIEVLEDRIRTLELDRDRLLYDVKNARELEAEQRAEVERLRERIAEMNLDRRAAELFDASSNHHGQLRKINIQLAARIAELERQFGESRAKADAWDKLYGELSVTANAAQIPTSEGFFAGHVVARMDSLLAPPTQTEGA